MISQNILSPHLLVMSSLHHFMVTSIAPNLLLGLSFIRSFFLSPIMPFKSSTQTVIGSQQSSQVFLEFNKGFIQFHDTKALFCSSIIEEAGFHHVFIQIGCHSLSPIKKQNLSQVQLTLSEYESIQTAHPPLKKGLILILIQIVSTQLCVLNRLSVSNKR